MENSVILLNHRIISSRKSSVHERVSMCACVRTRVCGGGGRDEELSVILVRNLGKFNAEESLKLFLSPPLLIMKYLNTEN